MGTFHDNHCDSCTEEIRLARTAYSGTLVFLGFAQKQTFQALRSSGSKFFANTAGHGNREIAFTIPVTKIYKRFPDLMSELKDIRSGRRALNKSLIWSQLTNPPRKKTAELWSGHLLGWNSCQANRKGTLESKALGFIECALIHSAPFHLLSVLSTPVNTMCLVPTWVFSRCSSLFPRIKSSRLDGF